MRSRGRREGDRRRVKIAQMLVHRPHQIVVVAGRPFRLGMDRERLLACGDEWVQEVQVGKVPILDPWRSDETGAHWPMASETAWIGKRRILGVWRTGADVGEGWQDGVSLLGWSARVLLMPRRCCSFMPPLLLLLLLLALRRCSRRYRCYRPLPALLLPALPSIHARGQTQKQKEALDLG